jgi:hypothetical protein
MVRFSLVFVFAFAFCVPLCFFEKIERISVAFGGALTCAFWWGVLSRMVVRMDGFSLLQPS